MNGSSSKPLITTIIPTYCRPKLLKRAIRSVLNQTYPHFQVCVYDNASGDETAEVVTEFAKKDNRVKYHCHKENIGAIKNFNYGMTHVDTPFFSFLSDDDLLLPEFYETALAGFEKHPEAVLSATIVVNLDDQGNILEPPTFPFKAGFYQPPEGLLTMLKYQHPTWTGTLFRSKVIKHMGILDEHVGPAADLDFELRIAAHFPFVISQKHGAIFLSYNCNREKWGLHSIWPGWLKMIRNLTEDECIPADVCIYAEHMLIESLKRRLFNIGIASVIHKDFEDAYRVSEILGNHFRLDAKAFCLSSIANICKYFPPAYYLCIFLNNIRKLFWRKKNNRFQIGYRNLLSIYRSYILRMSS